MKLDMGKAWTETANMLGANLVTVSTIAGLFLFLPYFAMALLAPETITPEQPDIPTGADPETVFKIMQESMMQMYADFWPFIVSVTLIQFFGTLSLIALLTDRRKPTVAEALMTGLKSMPIYIVTLILMALIGGIIIGLPLGLATAFLPPAVAVLLVLVGAVAIFYMVIKFTLVLPVIAIEEEFNPLKALSRSWRLTKGNSLRILLFLALLFLLVGIISALVQSLFGVVFAALGGSVAAIGNGFVTALANGVVGALFAAIYAAIHRQLAGPSEDELAATFE
ncbi:glycerophosphoryl diester phosphodiesterase membrane domain-containing protein [Erythrobacter sp. YT30]|uniref:glycerophosphoryl diester phosphodiesterase membrane domain-containing protein n=1 Tax=Erythrobacter sp. YT30 TaxID=1735012 RepID=UPI00076D2460|nr:glycerophosphoryl diester phosphodiesterase membrane domain-containing protein [Erythrobacter sp. YT30]KWV91010.1 hypothetical protein AUC45_06685 [Erythrobacter sp. YT30]